MHLFWKLRFVNLGPCAAAIASMNAITLTLSQLQLSSGSRFSPRRPVAIFWCARLNSADNIKVSRFTPGVILDNHFHAILAAPDLSGVLRDLKSFTARQIVKQLAREGREWLLNQLRYYRADYKPQEYQVWQEGSHPQAIVSDEMLEQKLEAFAITTRSNAGWWLLPSTGAICRARVVRRLLKYWSGSRVEAERADGKERARRIPAAGCNERADAASCRLSASRRDGLRRFWRWPALLAGSRSLRISALRSRLGPAPK